MAVQRTARGHATIVDLNDAVSVLMYLSLNHPDRQIEDAAEHTHNPDYNTTPLVITPELLSNTGVSYGFKERPTWKVNGYEMVFNSSGQCTGFNGAPSNFPLDKSKFTLDISASNFLFPLTVRQNLSSTVEQMKFECIGTYVDKSSGQDINTRGDVTVTRTVNTGQLVLAYITGDYFFRYGDQGPVPATIELEAQLIRGNVFDDTPEATGGGSDTSTFETQWYYEVKPADDHDGEGDSVGYQKITGQVVSKVIDGVQVKILQVNGNKLTVYPDAVDGSCRFRAKIRDTDPTSSGYDKYFLAEREVVDYSDPFIVRIDSSNGDVIKNGQGTTVLTAVVLSGGVAIDPADNNYQLSYEWNVATMDNNGVMGNAAPPATTVRYNDVDVSRPVNQRTLTVYSSDIRQKAVFTCDVSIKINHTTV